MKKLAVISITVFLAFNTWAKELKFTVIADGLRQDKVTDISNMSANTIADRLNKADFSDGDCVIQFISHGPIGDVRSVALAGIFTPDAQVPAHWSAFDAIANGKKYRIATYVDVTQLNRDSLFEIDTACWQ